MTDTAWSKCLFCVLVFVLVSHCTKAEFHSTVVLLIVAQVELSETLFESMAVGVRKRRSSGVDLVLV